MKRFIIMLTFFTRIPIKIKSEVTYDDYVKGVWYVPIVSVIISGVMLVMIYIGNYLSSRLISSVLVLAIYLLLTGGLHIDGMADTMDALGSNRSRQRMLEIMKDSFIGTFGVLAIVMYCISMVAIIDVHWIAAISLFPLVGRNTALLIAITNNYAREDGMGKSFVDGANIWIYSIGTILFVGLAYVLSIYLSISTFVILIAVYALSQIIMYIMIKLIAKKLGGITGDVIGYTIEVSQLVFLFVLYLAMVIV